MKLTLDLNRQMVFRWFIGLVLIWASLSKLANLQDFLGALLSYQLPFPVWSARLVVTVLPWLELLCGLALLGGQFLRPALAWSIVLFAAFVLATGQAWWRGLDINCGCLNLEVIGVAADSALARSLSSSPFAFFRALLLLGSAVVLWRLIGSSSASRGADLADRITG